MINKAIFLCRAILPNDSVFVFVFQRAMPSTEVVVGKIESHLLFQPLKRL